MDRDTVTNGIQEYTAWSAALKFFTDSTTSGGLNKVIPTVPYDLSGDKADDRRITTKLFIPTFLTRNRDHFSRIARLTLAQE